MSEPQKQIDPATIDRKHWKDTRYWLAVEACTKDTNRKNLARERLRALGYEVPAAEGKK